MPPLERQAGYFGKDIARTTGELEQSVNDGVDQAARAPSVSGTANTVDGGDTVEAVPGTHYVITARSDGDRATFNMPDPNLNLGKHITFSGSTTTASGAPTVNFRIQPGGAWNVRGQDTGITFARRNQVLDLMATPGDWVIASQFYEP